MGWMEKRHDGLRFVGGNDFRIRRRQEFHRVVRVFEQRLPSRSPSELVDTRKTSYFVNELLIYFLTFYLFFFF